MTYKKGFGSGRGLSM